MARTSKAALDAAKQLAWDKFQSTDKGISVAVKTVQGLTFDFTQNVLQFFCDEAGLFSSEETISTVKQYGNFSDFEFSIPVATITTFDGEGVDLDTIKQNIETFGSRLTKVPAPFKDKISSFDWTAIAAELLEYVQAIQPLVALTERQM